MRVNFKSNPHKVMQNSNTKETSNKLGTENGNFNNKLV